MLFSLILKIVFLLPTEQTVRDIWGENAEWVLYYERPFSGLKTGDYSPKNGFAKGSLGNYSSPNPLVEGCTAIFNCTYFALERFYNVEG